MNDRHFPKFCRMLCVGSISILLFGCGGSKGKLLGTWTEVKHSEEKLTFYKDGTLSGIEKQEYAVGYVLNDFSGKYSLIDDKTLKFEAGFGGAAVLKIKELTKDQLTLETEKGKRTSFRRASAPE